MFDLKNTPHPIVKASSGKTIKIVAMAETPELMIMDDIGGDMFGDGIDASEVKAFLSKHRSTEVVARFNSFGGDAFQGLVMHNAFQEHGNVKAIVDGIAFSAASTAAMGAKTLVMNEASSFGVHRAWTLAMGNQKEMQAAIEWLDQVDQHMIAIIQNRTGAKLEQVEAWVDGTDDGTIFSAQEALDAGFADEIIPLKKQREATSKQASGKAYSRMVAELKQKSLTARRR